MCEFLRGTRFLQRLGIKIIQVHMFPYSHFYDSRMMMAFKTKKKSIVFKKQ